LSEDVSGVVQAADEDRTVISVLICDDHCLLTDTLTTVIENDASLRMLTPPVHSSEEAVDLVRDRRPDVVLMDIEFRGSMSGIEATRQIKALSPSTKVVIMTAHREIGCWWKRWRPALPDSFGRRKALTRS